jgi:hypothetical protein
LMAIFEMAVILNIFTKVMTNYISVESLWPIETKNTNH